MRLDFSSPAAQHAESEISRTDPFLSEAISFSLCCIVPEFREPSLLFEAARASYKLVTAQSLPCSMLVLRATCRHVIPTPSRSQAPKRHIAGQYLSHVINSVLKSALDETAPAIMPNVGWMYKNNPSQLPTPGSPLYGAFLLRLKRNQRNSST